MSQTELAASGQETKFAGIVVKEKIIRKKSVASEKDSLTNAIIFAMEEVKANEIQLLDLRKIGYAMADYFIICNGNSNTQVQAIANSVEREVLKLTGEKPAHIEGIKNAKWVLIDYVNVVVHIFDKESRYFYALEELWADAEVMSFD